MYKYYLIAVAAAIITAFSQVLLKIGAIHGHKRNSILLSYLNLNTISGYCLLFVVTLLNVYAYKYIELKIAVVLLPMVFVLVAFLSYTVLKETFSKNDLIGSTIILVGIVVFNL